MNWTPKHRKRAYYSGGLAKPTKWAPQILPPGQCVELADDASPAMKERWAMAVARARKEDAQHWSEGLRVRCEKLAALADHFKIDRQQTGWARNLAMSLARRHEPEFMKSQCIKYAELFAKYHVDPDQPEADFLLALQLAQTHVPGMRYAEQKEPAYRLCTVDFASFTLAVENIQAHLTATGAKVSDRAVVDLLRDPKRLKTIVSPPAVERIAHVLKASGNKRNYAPGTLSDRALRGYLSQMATAWSDYKRGDANLLQRQFIEEVLPLINRFLRENDPARHGEKSPL